MKFTNKSMAIGLLIVMAFMLTATPIWAETKEERDQRMEWWREARFGMFIHWGLYAIPAGEWEGKKIPGIGEWIMNRAQISTADYKELAKQFNPVKYDADKWVRLAKAAGMKYIVITSKHHDGFAMYHSKADDFNIVTATPFDRDPLKELAEACRKHGLKLGFYYSQAQDWTHPGGASNKWDKEMPRVSMEEYIRTKAAPQIREILTEYGDIAILWWDTPREMTKERADMMRPLLELQPGIISNNRLGGGYKGDHDTPERRIPVSALKDGRDWETCMTMNRTWGFKTHDHNWKSTETLIQQLVDIVSKNGNFLLNVGPTAEGLIPQPSVERLRAIGKWMKKNKESIYGAGKGPYKPLPWGRVTAKPGKLYIHVFDWPTDGRVVLPGLTNAFGKPRLLAKPRSKVKAFREGSDIVIKVGRKPVDPIDTVIVLPIKGEWKEVVLPVFADKKGNFTLKAVVAEIHGKTARYEGGRGKGNIGFWTDKSDWISWKVRADESASYRVEIEYSVPDESAGATFQITDGTRKLSGTAQSTGDWKTFKKLTLGNITLSKGMHQINVIPQTMPKYAVMNLKAIRLMK
jgi:alpha-L-fucosidase